MSTPRRLLPPLVLAACLAPAAPAAALPPNCSPPGSRVVDGSVVRWHRVTWFCATHPRRLVVLPLPVRSGYVDHVVARGRFLAFSYLRDPGADCDNHAPGARSIDRNTGALVFALPVLEECVDVHYPVISDVALRSLDGSFAVIRQIVDQEDDQGSAAVITVSARGVRGIDDQPKRLGDRLSDSRIFGHSLFYDGRLHYRRADGRQTVRL